jgi:predicted permease
MRAVLHELRYACRRLRRSPGFTAVAVSVLAVGIGANVAVWSVVSGVYLHGLPYADVDSLVMVWEDQSARGGTVRSPVSPANFLDWREQATSFSHLAALRNESRRLTVLDRPVVPLTHLVTPDYFELLGVRPRLGRAFEAGDAVTRDVVIISNGLWQEHLGGDPDVVGRTLELAGDPRTIIGVLGPDFYSHHFFATQPDLWLPTDFAEERAARAVRNLVVFGRLAPAATLSIAQRELDLVAERIAAEHPASNTDWGALVEPLRENLVGSLRQTFLLLLGAVALVLLIACANVTHLFLARSAARRDEVALRVALGASGGQVMRQLVVESLLVSIVGGAAGVLLASLLVPMIAARIPQNAGVPFVEHVRVDTPVLGVAFSLALLTGLVLGVVSAQRSRRTAQATTLRSRRNVGAGARGGRDGGLLIAAQVALAVVVVIGAGLLVQSLVALHRFDPGFAPEGLFTWRTGLRDTPESPARPVDHFAEVERRLLEVPGIEAVGCVSFLPPLSPRFLVRFASPAIPETAGDEPRAVVRAVTAGYLPTMGVRLESGRHFATTDLADSAPVALVNEALVRRYFPDREPLGQTLTLGSDARGPLGPGVERRIVGVVGNVLSGGTDPAPQPALYLVHPQAPVPIMNVMMRASVDPLSVAREAERVLWSAGTTGGEVNVYGLETLEQAIANTRWRTAFATQLLSAFALLALVLGSAGIFAVTAHAVVRRTSEIGLRMALGARTVEVLELVLVVGLRPTLLGIAVGSAAALGLARLLRGLLYAVTPTDPVTFLVVGTVLAATAVTASLLPAWRAARVDPVEALRTD